MKQMFYSGASIYDFAAVDDKAVVVALNSDAKPAAGALPLTIAVQGELVRSIGEGNAPLIFYLSGQLEDPLESGEDFYQFVRLDNVTYDKSSQTVSAQAPASIFSIRNQAAIFIVAAERAEPVEEAALAINVARRPVGVSRSRDSAFIPPLGDVPLIIQGSFGEWRIDDKRAHQGMDFRTTRKDRQASRDEPAELPVVAVGNGIITDVIVSQCKADKKGPLPLFCASGHPMLSVQLRVDNGPLVAYRHLRYGSVTDAIKRLKNEKCLSALHQADLRTAQGKPYKNGIKTPINARSEQGTRLAHRVTRVPQISTSISRP
ncbi:hypothetical protein [Paraburkholderia strydomiana]|uniref:hypothetical protein n=1 Tax=Paraburkholderia strydomiana TaxID=1245417 RepID=UPI0038B83BCC